MTTSDYIQQRQQAWALRRGIHLQGSAGDRGEPNYTRPETANFFEGVLLPSVKASFERGAGGEMQGKIPTISALHSSAALAVNLFHNWVRLSAPGTLATLLDVPSRGIDAYEFEDRFPVCDDAEQRGFKISPHLDFAFRYKDGSRVGIECKLHEPYGRLDHQPLRSAYLDLADAWADIPAWRAVAEKLAGAHPPYQRLGASQLVKHTLGLKHRTSSAKVRLVYLYYDVPGDEAAQHREELARFQKEVHGDPVRFQPLTVQEFIVRAVRKVRDEHRAYVDYLAERYL